MGCGCSSQLPAQTVVVLTAPHPRTSSEDEQSGGACPGAAPSRVRPPPATPHDDARQLMQHAAEAAAALTRRAEAVRASLGQPPDSEMAAVFRGVVLADFSPSAQLLQAWSDSQVREVLSSWGSPIITTKAVEGGHRSTVCIPTLPGEWGHKEWHGEVALHKQGAERSAAVVALASVMSLPELGCSVDLMTEDSHFLNVAKGDELEIVVREREGWACCRHDASGNPKWVPANAVAELAQVSADHTGGGSDSVLDVRKGDIMEVVMRHHSGWSLCREWLGVEFADAQRKEGWVTDAFLDDGLNPALKFYNLAADLLARVEEGAEHLEQASISLGRWGDISSLQEKASQCMELAASLAEELEGVSQAIENHQARELQRGTISVVLHDVALSGPGTLCLAEGDQVRILQADASGWVWCRGMGMNEDQDGWVPQSALRAEPSSDLFATLRSEPPAANASTLRSCNPVCAICLEPLRKGDHKDALPCAHTFHHDCLGPWLAEKTECPLCRAPAVQRAAAVRAGPQRHVAARRQRGRAARPTSVAGLFRMMPSTGGA
eukprot:CAMPEP_0195107200 /NCGR_PEP_ID=MMETSP0448-20130528/81930_1 /TAXON_ID=66468 /ORGANISM="Heterocapsa triquestra, Strain CCMP 448" /LENGTH=550 /DNA_ID=CAMNT_0040143611 /DNA_START=33 /DNA_END=1685 /DNA_ORIENTATION=+